MTETELKLKGYELLNKGLGLVETERLIGIIQRDTFDYTKWRSSFFNDKSVEEISKMAMDFYNNNQLLNT
ncbi:MAG: hypothetical protein HW421_3241 [Ignavibacteria bacterium]|nr:hypothetical protein [Ignavibacteria bacterium]